MRHRIRRSVLLPSAAALSLLFAGAAAPLRPAAGQAADPRAEVYNLRSYTHPNFTRLVLDIGTLREFVTTESRKDGFLTVDILQARLNPIVPTRVIPTGGDYIGGVRLGAKSASTVRLTVAVNYERVKRIRVFPLLDPFRIVVDITPLEPGEPPSEPAAPAAPPAKAEGNPPAGKTSPAKAEDGKIAVPPETKAEPPAKTGRPVEPAAKSPHPAAPASSGYTMARQLGLGVKTIVIDPGHGGADPGCLDAKGHTEKVAALDISLRLKALLTARGEFDVILTRESDILVPLETRTVLANQKKADLFISVHVNAFADKRRHGIETFYLNFSPDPWVNELAARENATTRKTIGEMEAILKKIVETSRVVESRELAQRIQANLIQYLSRAYAEVKDLGTRGGPFWVLIGSDMPAVLVEVSHFSNPDEAARLMDAAYRQKAAEGIYEGIVAYRKSLGKG